MKLYILDITVDHGRKWAWCMAESELDAATRLDLVWEYEHGIATVQEAHDIALGTNGILDAEM